MGFLRHSVGRSALVGQRQQTTTTTTTLGSNGWRLDFGWSNREPQRSTSAICLEASDFIRCDDAIDHVSEDRWPRPSAQDD